LKFIRNFEFEIHNSEPYIHNSFLPAGIIQNKMVFDIKTPAYEGPLDLLVSLIEKREIFISDISISQVTDDYIEYINNLEEKNIDNMSDFILIASTLVLIKSKSLLPTLSLSLEEEEDVADLETRIDIYKIIRECAEEVRNLIEKGASYERGEISKKDIVFAPSGDINIENIFASIKDTVNKIPVEEKKLPEVSVKKVASLKDTIESLRKRIQQNIQTNFKEFSGKDKNERVHVVIHFLALLELIKQEMVKAHQETDFGDILIESDTLTTPKYGN